MDAALPPTASQCAKLAVLKLKLEETASMGEATIVGVDVAKNVFHLHGATSDGSIVFRKKLSRLQFGRLWRSCRDALLQWRPSPVPTMSNRS